MGQTVAFIGLGIMGGRMVKNVLKAGYAVRAQNRTAAKAEALKPLGATVVATPREAAAGADIVVTMVADPPALAAVLEGPDGVFAGCRPGTLVVDMSTVDPGTSQAMAAKARALGLRYLEAPVTGGVGAAEQGTLTIMAGGSAEDFAAAKPLLETHGEESAPRGADGAGFGLEALRQSGGGEHHHVHERSVGLGGEVGPGSGHGDRGARRSAPRSSARTAPKVLSGDFSANFPLKHSHKDVQLALSTGRQVGTPMFASAAVAQLQARGARERMGRLGPDGDDSVLEEIAGVQVRKRE